MRRMLVVLAALAALSGLLLGSGGTADANIAPGGISRLFHLEVRSGICTLSGNPAAAATSAKASSVNIRYQGVTCSPPIAPFAIGVNLYTWNGKAWAWTKIIRIRNESTTTDYIAPAWITTTCNHLAVVKARLAYVLGTSKTSYWTNQVHCS